MRQFAVKKKNIVFPARAGMSLRHEESSGDFVGVPRASGDEPRKKEEEEKS